MDTSNNAKELFAPSPIVLVLSLITIYLTYKHFYPSILLKARGLSLPPGPSGKWITGNGHDMKNVWNKAMEWSKAYGPIVYIQIPCRKFVILNTAKAAFNLLDKRSKIYSERPTRPMMKLTKRDLALFATSFSDPRFKILRRLVQDGLNPRAVKTYWPIMMQENRVFLRLLANQPEEFRTHIRRNAVATIIKATYGYQVQDNDDYVVRIIEESAKEIAAIVVPGRFLVDFFPFLRFLPSWFPFAGFKRYAAISKAKMDRVENVPFDWAKKNISSGNFVDSFVSKHLLTENGPVTDAEEQDHIKWASSAIFTAGGESVVSALSDFFLCMALYPEVQKKAQEHIEQLVPNRLPTLDDYDSLPYIRALLKEVARWAPVNPLGLQHCVSQDDIYEQYFIPKGTIVMGNVRAIGHDEEMYPNPYNFDPSRFMGDQPQPDPYKFIFGFGRRICPGSHFADLSLFLNVATILTVFDISKAVDQHGKEIEPKMEWIYGVTANLAPFKCQIKPRSKKHLALLDAKV